MSEFTKDERREIKIALLAAWEALDVSGSPMSDEKGKAYIMALSGLTVEQIKQACISAMRKSKFFPKPVELRGLVGFDEGVRLRIAWDQLLEGLRAYGRAHSVCFVDPVLAAAVRELGGLRAIAQRPTSDLHSFVWHRFKDSFLSLVNVQGLQPIEFETSKRIAYVDGEPLGALKRVCVGGHVPRKTIANSPVAGLIEVRKP